MASMASPGSFSDASPTPPDLIDGDMSSTVCTLCRQRKMRCDRMLKGCANCKKSRVTCQYVSKPVKRGLRAGYVSQLEERLEILEQEMRQLKEASIAPRISDNFLRPTAPDQHARITPFSPHHFLRPVERENWFGSSTPDQIGTPSRSAEKEHLSLANLTSLCEGVWFKEYHPWFPILHRPTILASLDALLGKPDQDLDLVLKAVILLTVSHSSSAIQLGYKGRRRLSQRMRSEVLIDAIGETSLRSVQALLVIAILDYGYDQLSSAWSLLAMCKRTCEQLGVHAQVLNRPQQSRTILRDSSTFDIPPLEEQGIRLYWMTLALNSASSLGASWFAAAMGNESRVSPMAYDQSASAKSFYDAHMVDGLGLTSSFKAVTALSVIGLESVHRLCSQEQQDRGNALESRLTKCEKVYNDLAGHLRGPSSPSYTLNSDGSITFDPNAVLGSMMSNAAIITLYQRYLAESSLEDEADASYHIAKKRCDDACDRMIQTISTVGDSDIEFISPLLASYLFVAARFQLGDSRRSSRRTPPQFDVLMHSLNMCGRRWPLARRHDIVLRAAISECNHDRHSISISVPAQFFDLRQSALEIDEILKEFVLKLAPVLYVGSLNGPYYA